MIRELSLSIETALVITNRAWPIAVELGSPVFGEEISDRRLVEIKSLGDVAHFDRSIVVIAAAPTTRTHRNAAPVRR